MICSTGMAFVGESGWDMHLGKILGGRGVLGCFLCIFGPSNSGMHTSQASFVATEPLPSHRKRRRAT